MLTIKSIQMNLKWNGLTKTCSFSKRTWVSEDDKSETKNQKLTHLEAGLEMSGEFEFIASVHTSIGRVICFKYSVTWGKSNKTVGNIGIFYGLLVQ